MLNCLRIITPIHGYYIIENIPELLSMPPVSAYIRGSSPVAINPVIGICDLQDVEKGRCNDGYRVSFIGHSAGGLIIRRCLEVRFCVAIMKL